MNKTSETKMTKYLKFARWHIVSVILGAPIYSTVINVSPLSQIHTTIAFVVYGACACALGFIVGGLHYMEDDANE